MNILVITQYYYPEPFRINEICEELVKRKNKVTVITGIPNYPDGDVYKGYKNKNCKELINDVTVFRCAMKPRHKGSINLARNYISFVKTVNNFINKNTIDFKDFNVIYVYQLSPVTSVLPAIKIKKKYGVPLFLYCLDVWPESLRDTVFENEPFYSMLKFLSKWIYKKADKLAVTSPSFVDYLSQLCSIPKAEIQYIPQHANLVEVMEDIDESFMKYKAFTNFVFIGNVGESQNVECIIKAVSSISDRTKFKIHIIGSGSHLEVCKNLATKLEVLDTVIFHGRHPKSEMSKFYSLADVCFISLKNQGIVGYTIPGKLQECMSTGKAILGCINGDASQIIVESHSGYCVAAGDTVRLANSIVKLVSLPRERLSMGKNAKEYYFQNFLLEKHIDELESMLKELISWREKR